MLKYLERESFPLGSSTLHTAVFPLNGQGSRGSAELLRQWAHCLPTLDSVTVSLFVSSSDFSNSETVAATLWERVQNLWWAWAQKYVLERAVFWRISPPTHMKSILRGLLGSQVHHRGAGRSFSITLPDTSCLKCVGSSICSVLASIGFVLKTRYISAALN